VNKIASELAAMIAPAELRWTISIAIPGDDDFPTLQLPGDLLTYSTERGYPISLAARRDGKRTLLFVQLESFDVAKRETDKPDWAIPLKYTPRTDDERIAQALGFDEGWEDAEPECMFVCDDKFAVFWRAALTRKRFGLTTTDAGSLYVVNLGERETKPIEQAVKAWAS
jgi:hypothetical protein